MAAKTVIQVRRDTAANWTSTNPTLAAGEVGFETDTLKFKVGNGSTAWTSLTYSQDASLLSGNASSLTSLTTTGNATVGGLLKVTAASGLEGGEIELAAATAGNTTLSGNVKIDVYGDKLRFWEATGTNRGYYINLANGAANVGTSLGGGVTGAMNYAQTQATKQSAVSASGTTLVSVSMTTNGYPVQVLVTGDMENNTAGGWVRLQLYRDTTAIGKIVHAESSAGSENVPYALTVVDAPAAGTYTYSLKLVNSAGGTFNFGETDGPVLTCIELSGPKGDAGTNGTSGVIGVTSPITNSGTSTSATIGINATNLNTANYVVQRDASGNFAAGTITAKLSGSLVSSSVGAVHYQSAADTTGFLAAPSTDSSFLTYSTGGSAPAWATPPAAMAKLMGYTSTATTGGSTTLTASSSYYQQFTGTSVQTVVLPVTSTLALGWTYHIVNNTTQLIVVNSSGGNQVIVVPSNTTAMVTCIDTAVTTAAGWESGLTDFSTYTGTGDVVLATSPTFQGTPAAPTANPGTSTTQIATTAFVAAAVSAGGGTREYTYLVSVFK